ncbi:MAG: hypothetical protein H8D23_30740 [Candidatus Brocadiales bacterium]|nr:hypothetical protein [Candidatus Brocadiales bacterium]
MKKTSIAIVILLSILCSCFAVYAQQDSQPEDPAAQIAAEDQSTKKDVSEYTDEELIDLYLNDPQNLPEMDDEQLSHLTDLAVELQNAQSQ